MKKTRGAKNEVKTVIYGKEKHQRETYDVPKLTYSKQKLLENNVGQWIFMGHVAVDSGRLLIIDPCKIDLLSASEIHGICWDSGLAETIQVNTPKGKPGLAVIFDTGLGDGLYEVFGLVKKVRGIGLRIAEVKIEFIPNEFFKINSSQKSKEISSNDNAKL